MHRMLCILTLLLLVLATPAAAQTDEAVQTETPVVQQDSVGSDQPALEQGEQRQALDIEEKSWSNIKALWG
ncbi:MAG: hypothetical protein JW819_00685 [Candidatus Krumholzibacteriota bacterium]|nr:hypothetical protein [Candidatus Krumholzibacteriota bacterium]